LPGKTKVSSFYLSPWWGSKKDELAPLGIILIYILQEVNMPKGIYIRPKSKFEKNMEELSAYVKKEGIDISLIVEALFPKGYSKGYGRRRYSIHKVLSEEHKRKIGLKSKGRKHTEESKLKMRIAKLGDFLKGQEEWRKFKAEREKVILCQEDVIKKDYQIS